MEYQHALAIAAEWEKENACGHGAQVARALYRHIAKNGERYLKLRRWMGSNVTEGWQRVEELGVVCAWMGADEMDAFLDSLPECNFGLMKTKE
jgi:hypothetical protein